MEEISKEILTITRETQGKFSQSGRLLYHRERDFKLELED